MITGSESFNYHKGNAGDYTPEKAWDANLNTWYSVKDGAVSGNYLKLYLSQASSIGQVKMTSRTNYVERMISTKVIVYFNSSEVASCGKITGRNFYNQSGASLNLQY